MRRMKIKGVVKMENEAEEYREKIVEMVNKINKTGTLEYLHTFIKLFLEKWGC